jgi:hypothetical protein
MQNGDYVERLECALRAQMAELDRVRAENRRLAEELKRRNGAGHLMCVCERGERGNRHQADEMGELRAWLKKGHLWEDELRVDLLDGACGQ